MRTEAELLNRLAELVIELHNTDKKNRQEILTLIAKIKTLRWVLE